MKIWKSLLAVLVTGATLAALVGCASDPTETDATSSVATVSRGNVSVDITAAGNLALSHTEDLAFEVAGTVFEVLVEAGDSVTQGQELAKLDTTEWDKQVKTLNKAVVSAQRSLTARENDVTKARRQVSALERQVTEKENAVTKTEQMVTTKELAVQEAELAIQSAEEALNSIQDVKQAQDAVDGAEMNLEVIKAVIRGVAGGGAKVTDINYWNLMKTRAAAELADAQETLEEILDGTNIGLTEEVALQVAQARLQVDKKKLALQDAQIALNEAKLDVQDADVAVDDAKYAVEEANFGVETAVYTLDDAESNLADAQEALDEAESLSPIITAPFDGFISKINVEGGDEVLKGTIAMQIADPSEFEADILVSEIDIVQVQVGGRATVQADAVPDVIFPATVTKVSPTATIQAGVVNYNVKVEVENFDSANLTMSEAPPASSDGAVTLPPPLQQAVDEGRLTQEQAQEMLTSGPPEGFTPPEGFSPPEGFTLPEGMFPGGSSGQAQSQLPADLEIQNAQLRDGLTVTVTITVARSFDVLVVPNTAVTTRGGLSYVEVITASGATEQRQVETGLSDWQYTEISSGLAEGEQVSVPRNVAPDTGNQDRGFFGPPPR